MSIPLSLYVALRFSRGRRRGSIVSLMSVISTVSITLGVSVLIISLSAMNGFERELDHRILSVVPHGEIEPVNSSFSDWKNVIKNVEQVPGILSAAPYINFIGLIGANDTLQAIQIKGVDPEKEMLLSSLPVFVQNNTWQNFSAGNHQIIIGKSTADTLQLKQGDWLSIMIPNKNSEMRLLKPKCIRLQLSGILAVNSQLDNSFAMVPLADAQLYLDKGKDIGGISIKVNDVFSANKLIKEAAQVTNSYVYIRSWIDTYGYMYRDLQMIRAIIYLAIVLVIGVACFNIVSTLVMTVKDKSIDIAILRTLGAKDRLIRAIFFWYGFLVGLTGSVIGGGSGVLVALNLTKWVKSLEIWLGGPLFSGDIYFIDFLPSKVDWLNVINVLGTTLLLSLLASWYPARRATRIDPARVLSGE